MAVIKVLTIALTLFGLLMVGSASVVTAQRDFSDRWYYLKLQSVWAGIGLVGFFFASRISVSSLEKIALPLMLFNLLCLVLVLVPGIGLKLLGSRRWLNLGWFSFQPAELAKLSFSLYLASFLKSAPSSRFFQFLLLMLVAIVLILMEPDLGTALIILGLGLATYFVAGGRWLHFISLVPVVAVLVLVFILASPYRAARMYTFLDSTHDPLGASYQVRQGLISLGSGGLFGRGLGQSRQKYEFLPEVTTDSIFAVIGEEFGLTGSLAILFAFWLLIHSGFVIAATAATPFTRNLATAISSWLGVQAFLNLSSLVALTPLTGVPLPFISYGGSSLVAILFATGILVNISRHEKTHLYRRSSH